MKKTLTILFIFILTAFLPAVVYADDSDSYDYYIKDFQVDVVANSDRSYDVTETITVYFNVESRGIFRDIDTVSSAERYRIENINVLGDPFVVTERYDYINVRIGDPDVYITGEKTYVITYTRLNYDDGVPNYDYFYMDLIGDRWDVPILNFSATVRLPETAEILNYTITSGPTGSTGNDYARGELSDNTIDIWMRNPLGPFMAVTLNVEMSQGAFPDAVVYVKPLIIHSVDVDAELDKYGVMTLKETYDATVNNSLAFQHQAYAYDDTTAIKWIDPDGEQMTAIFFPDNFLDKYIGERVQFSFIYQVKNPITEFDSSHRFRIQLPGNRGDISVEKYSVSVVSPFEITSPVFTDSFTDRSTDDFAVSFSDEGRSLSIRADADPDAYYASLYFYSSGYKRALTASDFIIPIILAFIAFLIYLFAFIRKPEKTLVTPIEFYPPDDMNPAEIGYVIDGKISGRDVTSLIFYWASHGHLSIEITDKSNNFILHKGSELDTAHQPYEAEMFEELFKLGEDRKVTSQDLQDKFYSKVAKAAGAVRRSFTGSRLLDKIKYRAGLVAFAMTICCGAMFYAFSRLWVFTSEETFYTGILAVLLYIVISIVISHHRRYKYKNLISNKALLVVGIVLFALFAFLIITTAAGKSLTFFSAAVTVASFAAASFSIPYLNRKTDYGIYLLERILGFKIFLTTAEKSRLEMLLEQNPDYYYNILPYAQILGVSGIWEKKFDGLLSQPPSWCYSDDSEVTIHTASMMGVTKSLTRSMTSIPSSGGGGGSSSGGGGFSGGGFSGGGGGGGGGRW